MRAVHVCHSFTHLSERDVKEMEIDFFFSVPSSNSFEVTVTGFSVLVIRTQFVALSPTLRARVAAEAAVEAAAADSPADCTLATLTLRRAGVA